MESYIYGICYLRFLKSRSRETRLGKIWLMITKWRFMSDICDAFFVRGKATADGPADRHTQAKPKVSRNNLQVTLCKKPPRRTAVCVCVKAVSTQFSRSPALRLSGSPAPRLSVSLSFLEPRLYR